jgi:catechol 2,3-dioxygenase-like lactoylglutathione lyase family enzyme
MKEAKTYGLTHIAIAVRDLNRTLAFYQKVFDMEVMYQEDNFLQLRTPGTNDVIVFEKRKADFGNTGGIAHFGFILRDPKDVDEMADRIKKAGGMITDKGEFVPGEPYIFFKDPDGYEVEIAYELPIT